MALWPIMLRIWWTLATSARLNVGSQALLLEVGYLLLVELVIEIAGDQVGVDRVGAGFRPEPSIGAGESPGESVRSVP